MKYIVKFFPEIMIKGDSVKRKMVRQLDDNLNRLFARLNLAQPDLVVSKRYLDKIEVLIDDSQPDLVVQVKNILLNTPGIEQIWQVSQTKFDGFADLVQKAADLAEDRIVGKTFVVRAKRAGTHEFNSWELEKEVGGVLFERGRSAGVDLKNPEVKIEIDVFDKTLNFIEEKIPALGGFPLGSQGQILSLMSGGFDSTVASYLSIKRGVKTHYLFFNLGGAAHEIGVKQVAIYLWHKFGASHRVKFISVPFEPVVAEMFRSVNESYLGVMLKRLMLQAAEQIADKLQIDALITGESVAQVSSQTMRNLALIDQATNKLVLRPLAFMNKREIMQIADEIGTRHFAEAMPEYCGVISQNPVTSGSFKRVAEQDRNFDFSVLDAAVKAAKISSVDELINEINTGSSSEVEVTNQILPGDVLVDISPEQSLQSLLQPDLVAEIELINLPFYELKQAAKKWSADKRYLIYCQQGVMSRLHAQYLQDEGRKNLLVYRP